MKEYADVRMHTAEHLLNRTVSLALGCGRAFSSHIEKKRSKCDYHFGRDLTPEERATGAQQSIERVCALEVDHKVPLWQVADLPPDERRWYFGPENLWLLCPACHKAKTKREAAERAAQRRFTDAQPRLPL